MGFGEVTSLYHAFEEVLLAFLLALPRAYAFIMSSQLLAPSAVPRLARNVAILVIAMPITPLLTPYTSLFVGEVGLFIGYFFKEFALGFVMGWFVHWLFWAVQAAGNFIDNQRGAAIAASIDPLQGHEASPLGILFSQAFITYFFAVGGFLIITDLLYASYVTWPVVEMIPIRLEAFPELIFEVIDRGMRLMFILAAPVIAIMFLAEFALAMVSRFAPQVQVFILAMPIKSALAVLILIFYIPLMMSYALKQHSSMAVYLDRFYEIMRTARDLP
ncbi:type III secretion system export apparatus subunit SctT [Pseudooceanicola aestuarii]|uniref:type III secretion system export apparatus subunit SctT n=1 Tax=Pseudooceanicola aestuarii TaxID=2697319 RepID=UPI0013D06084|nr:type III secretion system export apparatus subunit SctT [Pseudooceanicola aestuarii]